mmetsp:Transcript_17731/g.21269  ORF Transcript_17731/g.21269 Transcript_17731/m.21269 type:complete len:502 (-) Transcript_17731:508-2013(-)|eukprot:CAMPEP_0197853882 /NCGR_PEP_ID=MMETSP1438-20131217/23603_1 /TAXON_ID=1461541 /ORGANISM="Pterosperma sp., Strain CCMP1384" /LENGTH=501 /DNA_ID=CAMNT_0043468449 /DNA_START=274 /DNA_END=1779 /DNA_ORIENTATION=+
MVYGSDPVAFGALSNVYIDPHMTSSKDIMEVSNKLERAYAGVHPGFKQLTGSTEQFGASIRPKRGFKRQPGDPSFVPTCGIGHETDKPMRTFTPGPDHYKAEVDRFGGARLGKDSAFHNLPFSQADIGSKEVMPGRGNMIKEPDYGSGRLGALKGLQTPKPAEPDSPGPKYLLRSEPYRERNAIATDTVSTYGTRHSFDKASTRANSQGLFSSQTIKGLPGGGGRDAQMDHPGAHEYEPKCHRRGDGGIGDSQITNFKNCGPYFAYGKPGKTKFISQTHASVDNFGIFTPGPAHYDTTKIYSSATRTKSPDAKKIMYTFRPKLTMEMDAHTKRVGPVPGPGMYDPEVTRDGSSKELDAGCKIGTAKKLERAEEKKTIPYISPSHEPELKGKFSPGPVYNPSNNTVNNNKEISTVKSRGFSFGASARFQTGFESGQLWHRTAPAAPRRPLQKGTRASSSKLKGGASEPAIGDAASASDGAPASDLAPEADAPPAAEAPAAAA